MCTPRARSDLRMAASPRRPLNFACALFFGLQMAGGGALAGTDDDVPAAATHEGKGPALILTMGDDCREDYANELSAVGFKVRVSTYRSLDGIGRFADVPSEVDLKHLLIVGGYVIANHVAPATITRLLADRPKIRGLIGSSACATTINHDQIHAETARPF